MATLRSHSLLVSEKEVSELNFIQAQVSMQDIVKDVVEI